MKHGKNSPHFPKAKNTFYSALLVLCTVIAGCSGPNYWHKFQIMTMPGTSDQGELLADISEPVIDLLSRYDFKCRINYGHDLFYAACTHNDHSGFGQTTDTFVNILYPDPAGRVEIDISTNQLSYHPFTKSSRELFTHWRDRIAAAIDSIPGITYSAYEIE